MVFNINFNNLASARRLLRLTLTITLILAIKGFSKGITLIAYPTRIIDQNELVQVRWAESIEATLYFGALSGQYDNHVAVSATNKIEFVPSSEGMTAGIYYCRISNGFVHSRELPLYIESQQAPSSRSPRNGDAISTISPKFEWDAVPGIPFYHLILSDQPVNIVEDDQGEVHIEGANVIYQAITDQTEINYGTPDPSNFFNQLNGIVPPLLNNKTYNWIVLNNYGNNPALSSIVQSGVQGFTVNVSVNLVPPLLISPLQNAMISRKEIEFSWQSVNSAKSYQFELFELIEEDGSTSTVQAWQVITTATNLHLPVRITLKNSYYEWHVIALDATGKGVVSERRNFTYQVPNGKLTISTFTSSGNRLSRVVVKIKPIQGSGENVNYSTTNSGVLNLNLQPGTYQISCSKFGFRDSVLTAEVDVNQSSDVRIYLEPLTRIVIGAVVNQVDEPLANAQIIAIDLFQRFRKTMISDLTGKFQFPLAASTYQLFAAKPGYLPADTLQIDLLSQSEINLTTPLILKENTSKLLGKVTDQNGLPLFGAQVEAKGSEAQITTRTDMSGAFQLTIGSGSWDLLVKKVGYSQDAPRTISFYDNQTITLSPDLILNSQAAIISGIIADEDKGIEQVEVSAISFQGNSFSTRSNGKGMFSLSVPSDFYDLYFHREGYIDPLPQHLEVQSNQNLTDLIITMLPALAQVNGTISCNGVPLHKAIITNGSSFDTSRINGYYELKLSPGIHQLNVIKPGYFQANLPKINLDFGEFLANFNIELFPMAAIIKGRIISNNQVVPHTQVKAIQNSDTLTTDSDTDGAFLFSVAPGIWKLLAQKEGYQINSYPDIAVQSEQILQGIEIVLTANSGIIKGKVADSQANLAQASVACYERSIQAITDNSGNYILHVSPGNLTLIASKEGYSKQTINTTVTTAQTITLNFVLNKYGTISGQITDPTGTPINQAEALAIQDSDTLTDYSDYTGEYQLDVSEGTYVLQTDKLGYAAMQQQVTIQNGQVVTKNIELQFKPEEIAHLSGRITVDNQFSFSGVFLKVSGRMNKEEQTDLNGDYLIQRLETQFDYKLQPIKSRYFFTPRYRNYAPLTETKTGQNYVATLYGDISNNQEVSSFDGSLVLRIAARKDISPYFTSFPRDSLAADVSGNKKISSFDASLIFRYTVGLINKFPAQEEVSFPKKKSIEQEPFIVQYKQEMLNKNIYRLTVFGSELPAFYSLDAKLKYPANFFEPISIIPSKALKSMHREWAYHNGELFIALAGTEKINCTDTLFIVDFYSNSKQTEFSDKNIYGLQLELDEGVIPISIEKKQNIPDRFYVSQNYPNPFNFSTVFKVWIPKIADKKSTKTQVEIYNILGQKVTTIVNRNLQPGYYQFRWSSNSDKNESLSSGLYLLLVKYAHFRELKKMILVR